MKKIFENILLSSRFLIYFAVFFSLIASFTIFCVASFKICGVVYGTFFGDILKGSENYINAVSVAITAIDLYLVALTILIFAFGIYELFISKIETLKFQILEINSLDELKDKLSKTIIIVLIVEFFKQSLKISVTNFTELLMLSGGILIICLALFFLKKK